MSQNEKYLVSLLDSNGFEITAVSLEPGAKGFDAANLMITAVRGDTRYYGHGQTLNEAIGSLVFQCLAEWGEPVETSGQMRET